MAAYDVEICIGDARPRGVSLLRGLEASAPAHNLKVVATPRYEGCGKALVVWGAGHPLRNRWFNQHVAKGLPAFCWDMGYWGSGRGNETLGMNRVSVNAMHPQAVLMQEPLPAERWEARPLEFQNLWNPDGHVVLAGLGPKTLDQLYLRPAEWERKKLAAIQAALPKRRVIYRPKPGREFLGLTVEADHESKIEDVLKGAALAVCRHSNVAVDAMRCGIPASVEDGAAAAVFGPELVGRVPVPGETRLQFFHNLAWFQWSIQECWRGEAWPFLKRFL